MDTILRLQTPLRADDITKLVAGSQASLSGFIYTARDQAHKRLTESLARGASLPVEIRGQVIYYCGPTLTRPGNIIGACGPTTAARMDAFTPALLDAGLIGMIGKGARSRDVAAAIKRRRAVYFLTYAGCGALLSTYVKRSTLAAYKDLGPEAIYKLEIVDFPLIVGIDSRGHSVY